MKIIQYNIQYKGKSFAWDRKGLTSVVLAIYFFFETYKFMFNMFKI